MNKKLAVFCMLMSLSPVCLADVAGYASVKSGVSVLRGEPEGASGHYSDSVANLAVAGGVSYRGDGVLGYRGELEYTHFFQGSDDISYAGGTVKSDIDIDMLMVNGYLDLYAAEWMNFYLTAGAGCDWGRVKYERHGERLDSDRKSNTALQGGAGMMFNIGDHFSIDLGYRFVRLSSDLHSHNAQAGFAFRF